VLIFPCAGRTQSLDNRTVAREGITIANEHTKIDPQQQLFKKDVFYLTTLLAHEVSMIGGDWVIAGFAFVREEYADFTFVYEALEVVIDCPQADPGEDPPGLLIHLIRTWMCLELAHSFINDLKLLCCAFEWPSLHE
jgi:hypothetical protein